MACYLINAATSYAQKKLLMIFINEFFTSREKKIQAAPNMLNKGQQG